MTCDEQTKESWRSCWLDAILIVRLSFGAFTGIYATSSAFAIWSRWWPSEVCRWQIRRSCVGWSALRRSSWSAGSVFWYRQGTHACWPDLSKDLREVGSSVSRGGPAHVQVLCSQVTLAVR